MELTPPKAILFDWDNTLVNTWPTIHEALTVTFETMGRKPWSLEETQLKVNRSMRDAFPDLFGEGWEKAAEIYQAHFRAIHIERLDPINGSKELLEYIAATPVFLGVVSNKKGPNLRKEIGHIKWDSYFDAIVGADDAPQDKPHPDPLLLALKGSNISPGKDVWFIGDSELDLECANGTGCAAILYGAVQTEQKGEGMFFRGQPLHHHTPDHESLSKLIKTYLS